MHVTTTSALLGLALYVGFTLFIRFGTQFFSRLGRPGPYVPPNEVADYAAEYGAVTQTSRERLIPTRREQAPGVAVAVAISIVGIAIALLVFAELGLLSILLAIFSIVVGADTARVMTNDRVRRRSAPRSGSEGVVS